MTIFEGEALQARIKQEARRSEFFKLGGEEEAEIFFLDDIKREKDGKWVREDIGQIIHFPVDGSPFACRAEKGECPACNSLNPRVRRQQLRIYLRVFEFGVNMEKVWEMTPATLGKVQAMAEEFGTLCDRVYKVKGSEVKRGGYTFVEYTLIPKQEAKKPCAPALDVKLYLQARVISEQQMLDILARGGKGA